MSVDVRTEIAVGAPGRADLGAWARFEREAREVRSNPDQIRR